MLEELRHERPLDPNAKPAASGLSGWRRRGLLCLELRFVFAQAPIELIHWAASTRA
jgi:hypothetical protein